jgi:hypothetical protein
MFLGIDDNAGLVYESAGSLPDRPVYPTPTVSQARLISSPSDWGELSTGFRLNPLTWLFREDSFDAVTRTRRGRLYQHMSGASYPQHGMRVMPHPFEDLGGRERGIDGKLPRALHVYAACTSLLGLASSGLGQTLAIGNSKSASAWRIVQTEVTLSEDVMLTLKALTAFGVVPEINLESVRPEFHSDVLRALDRAVNSAFRETAESVVDQCRNAIVVVLARWLVQSGADYRVLELDLGNLAKEAAKADRNCLSWVASVVAKLHSRGKMNETASLRPVTEEDAEMAVQMLGFTLREVGWAR